MIVKAVLLMAGVGERFGSHTPKQFHRLAGKKVYLHTLERFLKSGLFQEIILVTPDTWMSTVAQEIPSGPIRIVKGGSTRQESSYLGVHACGTDTDFVVIHDGVRPLVSQKILRDNVEMVKIYGAVNTCIPFTDTFVHKSTDEMVLSIPNRSEYVRTQTPQSFSYPLILHAHATAPSGNATEDCQLLVNQGVTVKLIQGDEANLKITSSLDLFIAEQLLRLQQPLTFDTTQSLKGKKYVITGGTGGIGSAIAQALNKEGAESLIVSRSAPHYPTDLTDWKATQQLFENIGPIDGLINSLGLFHHQNVSHLSPSEIENLINVNFKGCVFACKYAQIKEKGHIVNIASSSYSKGRKGYAIYSAAKAAVVNFTQGYADERLDICVNAVVPQRTNTHMRQTHFPHEDPATLLSPETVAETIVNLLKQEHVTGSIVEIRHP